MNGSFPSYASWSYSKNTFGKVRREKKGKSRKRDLVTSRSSRPDRISPSDVAASHARDNWNRLVRTGREISLMEAV